MFVYRVESKIDGKGPYCSIEKYIGRIEMFRKHSSIEYPGLFCDFKNAGQYEGTYLFGATSIEMLMDWFGEFLPNILKANYRVYKYSVHNESVVIGLSGKQCIFNPIDSKKVLVKLEI